LPLNDHVTHVQRDTREMGTRRNSARHGHRGSDLENNSNGPTEASSRALRLLSARRDTSGRDSVALFILRLITLDHFLFNYIQLLSRKKIASVSFQFRAISTILNFLPHVLVWIAGEGGGYPNLFACQLSLHVQLPLMHQFTPLGRSVSRPRFYPL